MENIPSNRLQYPWMEHEPNSYNSRTLKTFSNILSRQHINKFSNLNRVEIISITAHALLL